LTEEVDLGHEQTPEPPTPAGAVLAAVVVGGIALWRMMTTAQTDAAKGDPVVW